SPESSLPPQPTIATRKSAASRATDLAWLVAHCRWRMVDGPTSRHAAIAKAPATISPDLGGKSEAGAIDDLPAIPCAEVVKRPGIPGNLVVDEVHRAVAESKVGSAGVHAAEGALGVEEGAVGTVHHAILGLTPERPLIQDGRGFGARANPDGGVVLLLGRGAGERGHRQGGGLADQEGIAGPIANALDADLGVEAEDGCGGVAANDD